MPQRVLITQLRWTETTRANYMYIKEEYVTCKKFQKILIANKKSVKIKLFEI